MIHVIIAEERRKVPRELALAINNDLRTHEGTDANGNPRYVVTPRPPQLHSMGERLDNPDDANILYAAEWDGKAPWITVLKGNKADLRLAFMGWPMEERAEYEARESKKDMTDGNE